MGTSDLKPCPFCGEIANTIMKPYEYEYSVGCENSKCLGFSGLGWTYDTEEEAIAAWNTRAERECRMVAVGDVTRHYECSICEYPIGPESNYCPHCGAKVVSES